MNAPGKPLAESFLSAVEGPARRALAALPDLEDRLAALLAAGRAAWPELRVEPGPFLRQLAVELPPQGAAQALAATRAEDVYLASACVGGDARAIRVLEEHLLPKAAPAIARVDASQAFVDEILQALREKLLVAEAGQPPKLAQYAGRGPLVGWLRIVASFLAIDRQRARKPHREAEEELADRVASGQPDVEALFLKARYRSAFQSAFEEALAALQKRDRTLLRMHFLDGLGVDGLAAHFAVHRSTAARWLARLREGLLASTRERLAQKLGLSSAEAESLMGFLRSQLEVQVSKVLRR